MVLAKWARLFWELNGKLLKRAVKKQFLPIVSLLNIDLPQVVLLGVCLQQDLF